MISARELKKYADGISILYVEDDDALRRNTERLLNTLFDMVVCAEDGQKAFEIYEEHSFDIIITDIHMPRMDGIKLIKGIKKINENQVVVVTSAHDESKYLLELINMGVDEFVLKPLDINQFLQILLRVVKFVKLIRMEKEYKKRLEATVDQKTAELKEALVLVKELSDEMVFRLTTAAEYRDVDTGKHITRIGAYAGLMAQSLGMSRLFVDSITFAAPLHDIGKIGIPDSILLKKAPLSDEEYEIMKTHTTIGSKILEGSRYEKINMIETVCLQHHERYDGTGYPLGLKGDEISPEGKIVNVCDQYDALRSKRPYKPALSHEESCAILLQGNGRTLPSHFDPVILKKFDELKEQFNDIYNSYQD